MGTNFHQKSLEKGVKIKGNQFYTAVGAIEIEIGQKKWQH